MVDLNFSFDGKPQKTGSFEMNLNLLILTGKTIKMDHINVINQLAPVQLVPTASNLHSPDIEQVLNYYNVHPYLLDHQFLLF